MFKGNDDFTVHRAAIDCAAIVFAGAGVDDCVNHYNNIISDRHKNISDRDELATEMFRDGCLLGAAIFVELLATGQVDLKIISRVKEKKNDSKSKEKPKTDRNLFI